MLPINSSEKQPLTSSSQVSQAIFDQIKINPYVRTYLIFSEGAIFIAKSKIATLYVDTRKTVDGKYNVDETKKDKKRLI